MNRRGFVGGYLVRATPPASQGCSTLWNTKELEERGEAGDGGTEAILGEQAATVGPENVEGEAAEAGEDAGVAADAGQR
jgi:hypothetical protein